MCGSISQYNTTDVRGPKVRIPSYSLPLNNYDGRVFLTG